MLIIEDDLVCALAVRSEVVEQFLLGVPAHRPALAHQRGFGQVTAALGRMHCAVEVHQTTKLLIARMSSGVKHTAHVRSCISCIVDSSIEQIERVAEGEHAHRSSYDHFDAHLSSAFPSASQPA